MNSNNVMLTIASLCMGILQMMSSTTGDEALVKIGAQHGQRYFAETRKQQRLRILEGLPKGGIDGLFDQAAGRFSPVPNGENRRAAECGIDVAQCHLRQIAGQGPPAAVPLF